MKPSFRLVPYSMECSLAPAAQDPFPFFAWCCRDIACCTRSLLDASFCSYHLQSRQNLGERTVARVAGSSRGHVPPMPPKAITSSAWRPFSVPWSSFLSRLISCSSTNIYLAHAATPHIYQSC